MWRWRKCDSELLWGFQNSTAWEDKHKALCWGNGISCVGGRGSEPMLLWADFIFYFLTHWVTPTDMSNVPFICDHLLLGMWRLMPYLPEQLVAWLTLVHISGRDFSCSPSLLPRRNSWGKMWHDWQMSAWILERSGGALHQFQCMWMCIKRGWACSDRPSLL